MREGNAYGVIDQEGVEATRCREVEPVSVEDIFQVRDRNSVLDVNIAPLALRAIKKSGSQEDSHWSVC